jgi:hypothetical protein
LSAAIGVLMNEQLTLEKKADGKKKKKGWFYLHDTHMRARNI